MENRLKFLLNEIGYKESSRKIAEKTGVSFTTTFRLAKNDSDYNCSFNNLDSLCTFFNVSIDFLMGKSEDGYFVYSNTNNEKISLTYDEAIKYKTFIDIKEMAIDNIEENSDVLPKTYIRRILRLDEMTQKLYVSNEVKKKVNQMTYFQLKDILDLIDKYILK